MEDRLSGYHKALKLYGLPSYVKRIAFQDIKIKRSDQLIEEFLNENPGLDALFFATNYLAISGLRVLKKKKTKVPDQIGVISFDDNELFELHSPTITSLSQPVDSIAEKLMEIMLKHLNMPSDRERIIHAELPGSLVVRESSSRKA
jgi:LacI family transcriptional regulator